MSEPGLTILDKLLDDHLDEDDGELRAADPTRTLRRSVERDLHRLLNARRTWRPVPPALGNSIMGYGLSDFTAGAYNSAEQRAALLAGIGAAIEAFEPRLENVGVRLRQSPSEGDPVFRIVVTAMLRGGDDAQQVLFETAVEAATMDIVAVESHD